MILYFDASALAKKYVKEYGSDRVISIWKESTEVFTSAVTYAEMMASFYRKKREVTITTKVFNRIIKSFQKDWLSFYSVELSTELHESIDRLVASYPLRGFDAIHLASALLLHEKIAENFLFACFDQQLSHAAHQEGLMTFPES